MYLAVERSTSTVTAILGPGYAINRLLPVSSSPHLSDLLPPLTKLQIDSSTCCKIGPVTKLFILYYTTDVKPKFCTRSLLPTLTEDYHFPSVAQKTMNGLRSVLFLMTPVVSLKLFRVGYLDDQNYTYRV